MKLVNRDKSFLFIKSKKYVVLAKAKEEWGNGNYELINNYTIKQHVNTANVSNYQQWIGRELYTYNKKGKEGKATIKGLYIISEAQPHFGMVQMYKSGEETKEQYTQNLADMAIDYAYLVAELDTEENIDYASIESQIRISASGIIVNDEILETELLKLLKETKQYKEYQEEYFEYEEEGEWLEKDGRITLTSFEFKAKKYIHSTISAGYGCGDFFASMSILWEVTNGEFKLITILNPSEMYLNSFSPDYMTDFDNDGEIELWDDDMLIKNDNGEWKDVEYIKAGYFDCPC